jgi:hypothetical protein
VEHHAQVHRRRWPRHADLLNPQLHLHMHACVQLPCQGGRHCMTSFPFLFVVLGGAFLVLVEYMRYVNTGTQLPCRVYLITVPAGR